MKLDKTKQVGFLFQCRTTVQLILFSRLCLGVCVYVCARVRYASACVCVCVCVGEKLFIFNTCMVIYLFFKIISNQSKRQNIYL